MSILQIEVGAGATPPLSGGKGRQKRSDGHWRVWPGERRNQLVGAVGEDLFVAAGGWLPVRDNLPPLDVDDPVLRDAIPRVQGALLHAIELQRRIRRFDNQRDECRIGILG